jgi:hypothetical protein
MSYQEIYKEDGRLFNDIVNRYKKLQENDGQEAFQLMKDSWEVFNRWSFIRADYRKGLKRGEKSEEKDRIEDICRFLKEVHTDARMIWKCAREDLREYRE